MIGVLLCLTAQQMCGFCERFHDLPDRVLTSTVEMSYLLTTFSAL